MVGGGSIQIEIEIGIVVDADFDFDPDNVVGRCLAQTYRQGRSRQVSPLVGSLPSTSGGTRLGQRSPQCPDQVGGKQPALAFSRRMVAGGGMEANPGLGGLLWVESLREQAGDDPRQCIAHAAAGHAGITLAADRDRAVARTLDERACSLEDDDAAKTPLQR
jgi:hypothetical protein